MPPEERRATRNTSPEGDGPYGRLYLRTLGGACLLRIPPAAEPEEVLGPGKPFAILTYLASSPGRSVVRDQLVDLLWSNLDLESARHALRQALWYLRQRLGRESVESYRQEVILRAEIDSDRDAFLGAVERGDFERAVELYHGEFLPIFAAPGAASFEQWLDTERYRLRTHFLRAGGSVVWDRLADGNVTGAKGLARRIRDADPLAEAGWRLLLEVLVTADDRPQARIEARAMERWLEEMEREPDPAVRRLLATAQDLTLTTSEDESGSRLHPELIGREREFASVLVRWRSAEAERGAHVHITGAAGLGKSRLLAEVADRLKQQGARVILLRAHPGRRAVAYALVSDLAVELAGLPGADRVSTGSASSLVALNPMLSERFDEPPDRAGGEEALRHREIALSELIACVANGGALAILTDDLHWADPSSRQILRSLCTRVAQHRLLLVTTARPGMEDSSIRGTDTELVSLDPLSEQDTGALLAGLGTLPDDAWAAGLPLRLNNAAGGSPLRILETLRLALDEGSLSLEGGIWACPNPGAFGEALDRGGASGKRVRDLPEPQQRLLLLLCVTGTPLGALQLAMALDRKEESILEDLHAMEVRDLVMRRMERWAPVHDEIVDITLGVLGEDSVREAHRAMGRALAEGAEDDADTLFRAALHLAAAGDWARLERAFARWVEQMRSQGDRRTLRELAALALGDRSSDDAVRKLVSMLPVGVRFGLTTSRGRKMALAGGGWLALAAVLVGLFMSSEAATGDALLIVLMPSPDGRTLDGYELPIRRAGWEDLQVLDVETSGRVIPALRGLPWTTDPVVGDPERGWLYGAVTEETWGPDLFHRSPDAEERRLTRFPGDDRAEGQSPDGRKVVLTTSRWDPDYWHDLAILDLETWETRALTRSRYDDESPVWSPDGTRIAFGRRALPRTPADVEEFEGQPAQQLCWITPDGTTERCLQLPADGVRPVGWMGSNQVVVILSSGAGAPNLARVHLGTGEVRLIEEMVRSASISPDARWVAVRKATGEEAWHVSPMDRPDLRVPLRLPAGSENLGISWLLPGGPVSHLERVEMLLPDTLLQGIPTRVRAQGFDPHGRRTELPVLTWAVDDTMAATVDSRTGVLEARALGEVTVLASAGGWREASRRATVSVPAHQTLQSEDWADQWTARWVTFGNPPPAVSDWVEGGRAFLNRGDGFYYSGVYSRAAFEGSAGLGMEVWVSTPITAARAQRIILAFYAWTDAEAVEEWDHRVGGLPGSTARCSFTYPPGDGFDKVGLVYGAGHAVRVRAGLETGEPYRVHIQLFPDGTCGVALDGQPLVRSEVPAFPDVPDRLVISGSSLGTRMLVGPLEVWEGVRTDIDWSTLRWDRDATAWLRPGEVDGGGL